MCTKQEHRDALRLQSDASDDAPSATASVHATGVIEWRAQLPHAHVATAKTFLTLAAAASDDDEALATYERLLSVWRLTWWCVLLCADTPPSR
jgi:hypothetical protein